MSQKDWKLENRTLSSMQKTHSQIRALSPKSYLNPVVAFCLFSSLLLVAFPAKAPPVLNPTWEQDLSFGDVMLDGENGSVEINATTGAKSVDGGVIDLGGTHQVGLMQIKGEGQTFVIVTLPASFKIANGDHFYNVFPTINLPNPIFLPKNGKLVVSIGGNLVLDNQPPETPPYTGMFTINVEYQ